VALGRALPQLNVAAFASLARMHLARRVVSRVGTALCLCLLGLGTLAGACAQASTAAAPRLGLAAHEALLIDTDTGTTLFSLRPDARVPIASTTKLMTAYVTLEYESLKHVFVDQPYSPSPDESLAGLTPGVHYTVADLLRAMLIPSGGDAANTLALGVGGGSMSHFIALMNTTAKQLGLTDTHYTTAVGLDTPGNYSTAANLATLTQYLLRNAFFAKVVDEPRWVLPDGLVLKNTDDLVGAYPFVVGVKTGHTQDAGYCLVGAASWHGVHLLSVVLGDPSIATRDADTLTLLRFGLRAYHDVPIAVAGHTYLTVGVKGSSERMAIIASRSENLIVSRAVALHVSVAGVPTQLHGPIAAGGEVGMIDVTENGKPVVSVPLVTALAVEAPATSANVRYVYGAVILALLLLGGCSLRLMRTRAKRRARQTGRRSVAR
jgi:D-alanyl-D-alanine carboxypeptidase (penicillin-binding protein 5/6)